MPSRAFAAEDDRAAGKAARALVPRRAHVAFGVPPRDPVEILEAQHATRDPELVPIRIGRMLETPFAYYRGSAAVMAHDLARDTATGFHVVACGDAHAANFGLFASPERRLVFDLNDFDEAYPGPWEWDVKRLAASLWLSGRNNGHSEGRCREAAEAAARSYRTSLGRLASLGALERYYFQVEADALPKMARPAARKARGRTSEQVLAKLATASDGGRERIVDQPPLVRHPRVRDMERMEGLFRDYRAVLRPDVALLLAQYELVDYALRIVGVGSVGTRCFIVLLRGPQGEPLFLQAKEAGASVLQTHGRVADVPWAVERQITTLGQGRRVVAAQRILQAQSDPMLGWVAGVAGEDGRRRDYYIRQFRDMKGSFALERLTAGESEEYGAVCGALLARAHIQSPGAAFIAGYLGSSSVYEESVARWARRYADLAEADHAALGEAVRSGRLPAETGV
ncbi:DUF2252 domain-containing protein [Zafaria sp. J156]|uniref:DUF2252 domain-containing protein n=1 Tax=Zafaria sp. J156 TaxID=3116490 RepID=UPI002E77184D|nr:DUF2252 domain-containing protein [Zafaria sp. J156]MEE1621275.1 DUF2252 domain-containing protein [Zafaria sp. J156]